MAWKIDFAPDVEKTLVKLGAEATKRIFKFLRQRVATLKDPRSIGESLKGSRLGGLWRYRAGDYRILCKIQDEKVSILVVRIGHRREVYK